MLRRAENIMRAGSGYNPYLQLVNYTMIYDEGDECTSVTGGWNTYANKGDAWGTAKAPVLTKGATKMTMTQSGSSTVGLVATASQIAWANYADSVLVYGIGRAVGSNSNNRVMAPNQLLTVPTGFTGSNPIIYNAGTNLLTGFVNPTMAPTQTAHFSFSLVSSTTTITMDIYSTALLKDDDWETWMGKGGVSGFATLASLLADATSMATLMSDQDAINFMVRQCTGTVMAGVLSTATALDALCNSADAFETACANEHWSKFLALAVRTK